MPKPNDRIGPYQLIHKLGRGSFGEVWLAQPENEKSPPVAVKLPNDPHLDFDALLQETNVWARAGRHPNVVEFLAARVFDQQAVIVSEYVPDGSLEQWLKQHGGRAPSIESAIKMTCGILDGLEHLHSKNIIHRDIKPANILMHGDTPRLADFGHSRVLASSIHSSIIAGTPAYMAPEAFEAVRNEQTDLWSVGVLLYQMLCGYLPFGGATSGERLYAILQKEPQPLPESVPLWLQAEVKKSLSKDPQNRFQLVAEMKLALQPLLQVDEAQPNIFFRPSLSIDEPVLSPMRRLEPRRFVIQEEPDLIDSWPTIIKWIAGAIIVIAVALIANVKPNLSKELTENLNGIQLETVLIPTGEFFMGTPDGEGDADEHPQHQVKIVNFYMGKYEVTREQWNVVMEEGKPEFSQDNRLPVNRISWNEAKAFCEKMSKMTGKTYRLPSEAEWEFACRGGGEELTGNLHEMAWCLDNSDNMVHPVGQKQPNAFGLFDMHGNLWEWCEDVWHNSYAGQNGKPPVDGSDWSVGGEQDLRVLRGGSWKLRSSSASAANRNKNSRVFRAEDVGFRVARTP